MLFPKSIDYLSLFFMRFNKRVDDKIEKLLNLMTKFVIKSAALKLYEQVGSYLKLDQNNADIV